jgi:hypothetical protein
MIVKTTKEINGIEYDYTYSDTGMMIERNGARYSEAVDPLNSGREYTETDEPIATVTEEATEADYKNALREMGLKYEKD